ncbi:MAG: hypothetical protein ACLQVD_10020 [Capsulimonadaceae bacterium]
MTFRRTTVFAVAIVTMLLTGCGQGAPKYNPRNINGYELALSWSPNPRAAAIRQQIANGPRDLAKQIAACKAEGISLTVPTATVLAPNKNAALVYADIKRIMQASPMNYPVYADPFRRNVAYTAAQLDAVRHYFASRPDIMSRLRKVTAMPDCVPAADYQSSATMRECAREVNTQTYLLAADRKYDAAIDNETRVFQIARHFSSDNSTLGYSVAAIGIRGLALSGMMDILALAGPNAEVDERVDRAVAANENPKSVVPYLKGDIPRAISDMNRLQSAGPRPLDRRFERNLTDAEEAYYLRTMRRLIAVAGNPIAFRQAADSLAAVDLSNPIQVNTAPFLPMTYGPLDIGLAPLVVRAREEVTRAAAFTLAAMSKTGAAQSALPGTFVDPFNGERLGYRTEGTKGFVVYSVGPTGKFDGGKADDLWQFPLPSGWGTGIYVSPDNTIYFRYPVPRIPVPTDMRS